MDETRIAHIICDWLNAAADDIGITFTPHVQRDNTACVCIRGGDVHASDYIDGSAVIFLPFDIKIKRRTDSAADVAAVMTVFGNIESRATSSSPDIGEGVPADIAVRTRAEKTKSYSDGCDEYSASYDFIYFKAF